MATLTETFTNIANAIRTKTGKEDAMTPAEMVGEIEGIEVGANIQTCTVYMSKTTDAGGVIMGYGATQLIDGVLTPYTTIASAQTQWEITNVVCGTVIAMFCQVPAGNKVTLNGSEDGVTWSQDVMSWSIIQLPNTPGIHNIELTVN